ncbi:polyprenyl synthetase family protein [Streptomyces sp. NRRL F-2580]|uniref:polyprenyl synthetase family protein n=1 Tax=Streptomyces sp. NRRL F-2580 TaxID=1463841 RepID=UPI0006894E54
MIHPRRPQHRPRAAGVRLWLWRWSWCTTSLLHDDIIDGDLLRRGAPAVWADLGVPAGILAGDALFFLAVQVVAEAPGPLGASGPGTGTGTAAVQELFDGEYADTLLETRREVFVADVAAMARGKTDALSAAACAPGAMAGGADPSRVDRYERSARTWGPRSDWSTTSWGSGGDLCAHRQAARGRPGGAQEVPASGRRARLRQRGGAGTGGAVRRHGAAVRRSYGTGRTAGARAMPCGATHHQEATRRNG